MATGNVNVIERHIEKGILGLAGAGLLFMAYSYLFTSPNQIEYGGQKVGPAGLAQALERDAQGLKKAVADATPKELNIAEYSKQLRADHQAGIFAAAADAPALTRVLPPAVQFGPGVPELPEEDEGERDIVLVTPLPPSEPRTVTGRSMVVHSQPPNTPDELYQHVVDLAAEPEEMPWVSVAAYFDTEAQQAAMTKSRYATFRSRVYVAGVEAQRQEVLSDGSFSDWQDVAVETAMPQLELPEPDFDDGSAQLLNKDDFLRAFALVRSQQQVLMQAPFLACQEGDAWKIPPLEGYEEPEEEELAAAPPEPAPTQTRQPGRPFGPVTAGGPSPASDPQTRAAERKQATEDLKEAKLAWSKRDYDQVVRLTQKVVDNGHATGGVKGQARVLLRKAQRAQQQARRAPTPTDPPAPTGLLTRAGAGTGPTVRPGSPSRSAEPLLTHPNASQKVVLLFHDDTVESGKTYRYRLRVNLWNRYFNRPEALQNPQEARQVLLVGDWSVPSATITVTPATYFFVNSATTSADQIRVDVWKWLRGEHSKQIFTAGLGDVIGGPAQIESDDAVTGETARRSVDFTTGAIVLDLRFDRTVDLRQSAGKKGEFNFRTRLNSPIMVYLDPADGQVKTRNADGDRDDPLNRMLKEMYEW